MPRGVNRVRTKINWPSENAGGGTRTPKGFRPPAPKAGALTNFATPASCQRVYEPGRIPRPSAPSLVIEQPLMRSRDEVEAVLGLVAEALHVNGSAQTFVTPRDHFSNRSDDIKHIFCDACDALGNR
jgi:hypothetical protein